MRKVLLLLLCAPVVLRAQLSGYVSSTLSAHSNPLYNFAMVEDRLVEGYWELTYGPGPDEDGWTFGYVGGLMLFNDLALRNYYEHRGSATWRGGTTTLSAMLGGRHDRVEYEDYDNIGFELGGSHRWGKKGATVIELSDRFGIRSYTYVPELSNVTNIVRLEAIAGEREVVETRYFASFGLKHFTTDVIDSSQFSSVQSSEGGNSGKGKGSGNGTGSGKKQSVLVTSSSANSFQITLGIAGGKDWEKGGMDLGFIYRFDPGSDTRLLAQVANSTILGEDIYNDSFSYAGPELSFALHQELPASLRLNVTAEAAVRNYLAPAFDLTGVETDPDRVDRRGSVQISVARSFPVGADVTMDLTLNFSAMRNMSNDVYNDYSASGGGISIGVGF